MCRCSSVVFASLAALLTGLMRVDAADVYVATNGVDTNPGTFALPFRTLRQAAIVLLPGDTCYIRGGVYRETLVPTRSGTALAPITFRCYSNESVTLNTAEVVTGWSVYSNHIYQAPMPWSLGEGYNQVFLDGEMMTPARFPNTGMDPMHPVLASMTAFSNSVTCAALDQPAGFWNGATLVGGFGYRWCFQCAKISNSTPGTLFIDSASTPWFTGAGEAYVTGVLGALDAAGEWHWQNSILYLWAPGDADPQSHLVEARYRTWCISFNGKAWIVVDGIRLRYGSVDFSGTNCVLQDCDARYLSHFVAFPGSGYSADSGAAQGRNGFYIHGEGNVVSNCTLALSAGSGIVIRGASNVVTRTTISDMDYSGTYACPLTIISGGGNRVWCNTFFNAGRDVIHLFGPNGDEICFNDLSQPGLLCHDLGVVYQWGVDGHGTRIAYNWIHDNFSASDPLRPGIYIDNYCRNFVVDHNVVWNCPTDAGVRINGPATNHLIYNNTLFNCDDVGSHPYDSWPGSNPDPAYWTTNIYTWVASNNLYLASSPSSDLVDWTRCDFRLLPSSARLNTGWVIPGFTDGFRGAAPEPGAYEFGSRPWSAGTNAVALPPGDSVGDGIPDWWRREYFGGSGDATNQWSCAACDPDADGADNRSEFEAGTDPIDGADVFRMDQPVRSGAELRLGFSSVGYQYYRVQFSDTLAQGSWQELSNAVPGTGGPVWLDDPAGWTQSRRGYRAGILQ